MQTHFLAYKNSTICFDSGGSGPSVIVCLHGFGESRKSFALLEKQLGKNYTLICPDFPFHEATQWSEALLLQPAEFLYLMEEMFEKAGLYRQCNFSLLGYSLGGRIALHMVQIMPERVERLVLLAPDGLRLNFWYWLGTQTWLGNKLFYVTMQNPAWFFSMANVAHAAGLLNKSIIKFVHQYVDDKEVRLLLYKRWTTMRRFKPNIAAVRKSIITHAIPVRFVFGTLDRIIPEKRSNIFKKDTANVKVVMIQAGHGLLKEKHVPEIARQFSE